MGSSLDTQKGIYCVPSYKDTDNYFYALEKAGMARICLSDGRSYYIKEDIRKEDLRKLAQGK